MNCKKVWLVVERAILVLENAFWPSVAGASDEKGLKLSQVRPQWQPSCNVLLLGFVLRTRA